MMASLKLEPTPFQLMIKPIQIRLNIETATPTSTDTATSRLESKDNGFL